MKIINIEVRPLGVHARWLLWSFATLTLSVALPSSQAQTQEPKIRSQVIDSSENIGDWTVGFTKHIMKGVGQHSEEKLNSCYLESQMSLSGNGDDTVRFTFWSTRSVISGELEDKVSVTFSRHNLTGENVAKKVTVDVDIDGRIVQLPGVFGQQQQTYHGTSRNKAFLIFEAMINIRANRRVRIVGGAVNFTPSLYRFDEALDSLRACIARLS